ncbi:hypothetical protein D3C87_573870 [compost metagenome]
MDKQKIKELFENLLNNQSEENVVQVINYAKAANIENQEGFNEVWDFLNICFRINRKVAEIAMNVKGWGEFGTKITQNEFYKSMSNDDLLEERSTNVLASIGYKYDYSAGYTKIEED